MTGQGQRSIVVTGSTGFVASRLLPRLSARGDRIIAIVRATRGAEAVFDIDVEIRRADLEDPTSMDGVFAGADAVVHLAGMALVPTMLSAMVSDGVGRGTFISSAGVYTKLRSASADAKRIAEAALRASPIDYTILRPSMIYGTPRDRNMTRLLRWIQRSPVVPAPLGGVTLQQPVHVDDLVSAIIASLDRPAGRNEYEVGGPEPISLREVIHVSADALHRRVWVLPVPLFPAHVAASTAHRLHLPFPVRPEQVLRLTESKAVDIGPARHDLGFEPRSFPEGIRAQAVMLRDDRD
jgi:nucleoside-diphosphate-sugar epimerase